MSNTIGTILIAIVVFGVLIFIHELGHFTTAKLSGVKVNEFALGMGPTLFRFGKGETTYALRLLPIGGFVSMEGEDEDSENPRAFCNIKVWKRIVIVSAGAVMNVILGFVILIILVNLQNSIGTTRIARFDEGAVSSQRLQLEDTILKVNGARVHTDNDIIYEFLRDKDGLIDLTVERAGEVVEEKAVPFEMGTYPDGSQSIRIDFKVYGVEKTFFGVLREAYYWTLSIVKQVWTSLIDLVTGQFGLNQLSGPVGVTSAIGQASSMGMSTLLLMVAFITINLGVFNILPLPALDGGRLLFLLVEAVRGKPVNPRYEGYVHAAGLILLFGLMIVVTFNDIVRLFQ